MRHALFLALLLPAAALAVPGTFSHQGRLDDAAGAPLTGAHSVRFALYTTESDGTPLWEETHNLEFDEGFFAARLGLTQPLPEAIDAGAAFLAIQVDAEPELAPRLYLDSVPFAVRASVAEGLAPGANVELTSLSVGGVEVIDSDGLIDWSRIKNAPAGSTDTLAELACATGETIAFDGVEWSCYDASMHEHAAEDITSGVFPVERLPIGSGAAEIAAGDHTHSFGQITGQAAASQLPIGSGSAEVASGDHSHNLVDLGGDLPISRVTGDLPISRVTGDLPISRVTGDLPMTRVTGNLDASRLTGSIPFSALPVGTTSTTVSRGDHTHALNTLTGQLATAQIPFGTTSTTIARGDHTHASFGADVDFQGNELVNARVQNATSAPTCNSAASGRVYFDSATSQFYGCNGTSWVQFGVVIGQSASTAALSCKDILDSGSSQGDGTYWLRVGTGTPFQGYCDMTTDGGGWTVLWATSGGDNQQPVVGDTPASGNPLAFAAYNLNRATKVGLSATGGETLLRRNDGTWIKASRAPFDSNLTGSNQHAHYGVTLTANNGTNAAGFMGWSNYNINGGGDFNLSQADGTGSCGIPTTQGVDHHSTNYWHLNCNCTRHYLYSYSAGTGDGDGSYKVNTGLGSWAASASCSSTEGGGLALMLAVR